MILNKSYIAVKFGTVSFYSKKLPLAADLPQFNKQIVLDPNAITGWLDGPGTRRDTTPRLAVDGDFYEPAVNSARMISITATAIALTPSLLQQLRDELMGQCEDGTYEELWITTDTQQRMALVGYEGTPQWVPLSDTAASVKIDLYAPDPRVYGDWQSFTLSQGGNSGSLKYPLKYPLNFFRPASERDASVKNNGNTRAYPSFKVTGGFTQGFSITDNRNSRVTFSGIVTQQAPVIIDMFKGTATQNGVDKSALITVRNWFSVKPGETLTPSFQPIKDGTGVCDIMFRDTWI